MRRTRSCFLLLATLFSPLCDAATSEAERQAYFDAQQWQRNADLLFHALPGWSITVNLLAASILFAVWRQQRNLSHFTWLLGASLLGNVWSLALMLPQSFPFLLLQAGILGWFYCLARILHPDPNPSLQRLLRTLFPLALVMYGMGAALALPGAHDVLTGLYCLLLGLAATFQWRRHPEQRSLTLAVWLLAVAGGVDTAIRLQGWHLADYPQQFLSLMPAAQMLAVVLALYFLVARHAENRESLRILNASLDQRVQAAEAELESRYRNMSRDSLDAAAMRERSQIYESIHEDLSDKLLQLIYRASKPDTADLARAALAELRDSRKLQADVQRPLAEVLADLYAECQSRCELASLPLDWQVADEVRHLRVNARQESTLCRTLREALSNLFKHAQAGRVEIHFRTESGSTDLLHYSLRDDGIGMRDQEHRGRGLQNMRQRLQEIGGSLRVDTGSHGTSLYFELPVQDGRP